MSHRKRRKYFVDHQVQSALIAKIVRYWVAGLATVGGLTMLGWIFVWPGIGSFVGADAIMTSVLPVFLVAVVVALLITPVIVIDLIRFSNRFAGPLFRLRRSMLDLAAGIDVKPVKFRKGDFCEDFADAFNKILVQINAQSSESKDTDLDRASQDVRTVQSCQPPEDRPEESDIVCQSV